MSGAMAHAPSLHELFQSAEYRVRLPQGGTACINIGQPLPAQLRHLLPHAGAPWGFITAWNPRAQACPRRDNRRAQRALRDALLHCVPRKHLHAALGMGQGWREPSLFACGIPCETLDALMQRFEQAAVVCGHGHAPAALHWNT